MAADAGKEKLNQSSGGKMAAVPSKKLVMGHQPSKSAATMRTQQRRTKKQMALTGIVIPEKFKRRK
jgi:hypothetical protein